MYTLTANFAWSDGATAVASITTPSPELDVPVQYQGAVDRLPDRYDEIDPDILRMWAARISRQTQAVLTFSESGRYDHHAL
jgi:hypothetical protein